MRKNYLKPTLTSEEFVSSQYIAACEYETSYKGKCDISGYVFVDNPNEGTWGVYDEGVDEYKYDNTACDNYFETPEKPEYNAFVFTDIEYKQFGTINIPLVGEVPNYKRVGKGTMTRVYNFDDTHVNHNIDPNIHHNVS